MIQSSDLENKQVHNSNSGVAMKQESAHEIDQSSSESESAESPSERKPKKATNSKNKNKIILNISDCQYPVVGKVAKSLGWKLQSSSEATDWDVTWTDNAVQPEVLIRMQPHQKINHFPGMFNLARKNLLGRALMRMRKQFDSEYSFFPMTWMLPVEYHELKSYYDSKAKGKARTFIVKPECLSQGKGIYLTRKLENINPSAHCVVQRYLHRPLLIQGLKFDLRIYVLIASVDPLRIYLYEQGLARFATEKYEAPTKQNMQDTCMHLTNYAINKDNPKFIFNTSEKDMSKGHKRSFTSVLQLMKQQGVDTAALMKKIKDSIIKTMISGLPPIKNTYRSCQPQNFSANMCFELLGFDIMLTDKYEPVLLEINHTPSFTTDTPLDTFIKFNYIKDSLNLMNISEKNKQEIIKKQKQACQQRVITGKKVKLTGEQKEKKREQANEKKSKFQSNHLGRFERIYPTDDQEDPYKKYIDYAEEQYQASTGSKRVIKEKPEDMINLKTIAKSVLKRPICSTAPDITKKRPPTFMTTLSKKSIQNKLEENKIEDQSPIHSPLIHRDTFVSLKSNDAWLATKEVEQPALKKSLQDVIPIQDLFDNKKRISQRLFKSNKQIQGDLPINKIYNHINTKNDKEKKFYKSVVHKDKVPITLNTLLINGLDSVAPYPINNLKKYLIGNKSKPEE